MMDAHTPTDARETLRARTVAQDDGSVTVELAGLVVHTASRPSAVLFASRLNEAIALAAPSPDASAARVASLEAEVARLRQDVIAFCGPWATSYAKDHGLPNGHLHPAHYDILQNAGARMDDFTRAALTSTETRDAQ